MILDQITETELTRILLYDECEYLKPANNARHKALVVGDQFHYPRVGLIAEVVDLDSNGNAIYEITPADNEH